MNEPPDNAYKSPESSPAGQGTANSRSPTVGAWLALLIFVPISFLIALVTTCTGSYFAIDAVGLLPAGGRQYISQEAFAVSLGLGAIAAIAVGILITRFILRFSRNLAAKRESNQ